MEVQSLVVAVGTGCFEVCLIRFQSRCAKETCQGQITKGPSHQDNWRGMHSLVTGVLRKCYHVPIWASERSSWKRQQAALET